MKQLQYFEIPKAFSASIASLINRKNFVFNSYKLDDKVRIINAQLTLSFRTTKIREQKRKKIRIIIFTSFAVY
jgi:hypothetical protein